MVELSDRLSEQLQTRCGHTIEEVLELGSTEDFQQILAVVEDEDIDEFQRHNAIQLLGRRGDRTAVPAIVAVMPGLDSRGLINAIDALGHLGGSDAARAVAEYAEHEAADVRRFVVIALERIGSEQALNTVATMARSDASGIVKSRARRTLQERRRDRPRDAQ